jgi:drug/metabolite transporter (DMT)-like permease
MGHGHALHDRRRHARADVVGAGHFIVRSAATCRSCSAPRSCIWWRFPALVAAGLQFVPAGRAIVLGYTTPLWVAIGAAMFLSEDITRRRAIGIGFGLAGLAVIFNPQTLNWRDGNALFGSGADSAGSVLLGRQHRLCPGAQWISTPFQLVFWQVLLAAALLSASPGSRKARRTSCGPRASRPDAL